MFVSAKFLWTAILSRAAICTGDKEAPDNAGAKFAREDQSRGVAAI